MAVRGERTSSTFAITAEAAAGRSSVMRTGPMAGTTWTSSSSRYLLSVVALTRWDTWASQLVENDATVASRSGTTPVVS